MSIKNREVEFSVQSGYRPEHMEFVGIRELGFNERGGFVIDAWTTPAPTPRGSYFTAIPISSLDYRQKHPTETAFCFSSGRLVIYDDRGEPFVIYAPSDILHQLVRECIQQCIPQKSHSAVI